MEDLEVRQALAVIKDRVAEMKKDIDWKEKMANEWNAANQDTQSQAGPREMDRQSAVTYESGRSAASKYSLNTAMREERRKREQQKQEWNGSVAASEQNKLTAEDRVAARIAAEVLKDNKKLGGVHSQQSIQKLLQREAKKLIDAEGGAYNPPVISVVKDKERADLNKDASNLPYLHKHPAV